MFSNFLICCSFSCKLSLSGDRFGEADLDLLDLRGDFDLELERDALRGDLDLDLECDSW